MHILIIDDHTIIRRGLRNLIMERYAEARITDCRSLTEAEKALGSNQPTMAVLDLILGDGNALDRVSDWQSRFPQTKLLVYSMVSEHLYAERSIDLGCVGFLSKQGPETEVLEALEQVLQGGICLSRAVQRQRESRRAQGSTNPLVGLSKREIAVMHDLLADHGIKEIAMRMEISPSTVATYKARLLDKLGIETMNELRRWAEIHGIIS